MRSEEKLIPAKFNAELAEIMAGAQKGFSEDYNFPIHIAMEFNGLLDEKRLQKAALLTLDAEPILGCSLITNQGFPPFWKRVSGIDKTTLCKVKECKNKEEDTIKYFKQDIPTYKGPMVNLLILRNKTDRLCIKMNHIVSDAGGLLDFIKTLGTIYNILKTNPDYIPTPNISGDRSLNQVLQQFNIFKKIKIFLNHLRVLKRWTHPKKDWKIPGFHGKNVHYIIKQLNPDQFSKLKEYSKKHNVTFNNIIAAATYRALYKLHPPQPGTPLRMVNTINLRKYLLNQKAGAITNLFGVIYLNIGTDPGNSLAETAQKVKQAIQLTNKKYAGMGDLVFYTIMQKLPQFIQKRINKNYVLDDSGEIDYAYPIGLRNAGIIKIPVQFDDLSVIDVERPPNRAYPPHISIGFHSFNKTLKLSACFFGDTDSYKRADTILTEVLNQLPVQ